MNNSKLKIALICTKGGHFEQLTHLSEFYNRYDHYWITNKNKQTLETLTDERKYFVDLAHFKQPWSYLFQLPTFIKVLTKDRPTHIVSTGSGRTAFLPFLLAKLLNIPFIYIDTFSRVYGYSKLGEFLLIIGYPFYSQWPDSENSKVRYIGPVFKKYNGPVNNGKRSDYIFVTLGTREEPFHRLVSAVEALKKEKIIKQKVVIQAGYTKYQSDYLELFDFCSPKEIDDLIFKAKYVITQESAGIGTKCLNYQTRFIVMPRNFSFGELPTKSDENEDLHLKLEEMGYTKVAHDLVSLKFAVQHVDHLRTGFDLDNRLAITTLIKRAEAS